jgi:signal transduction histidine kinase
MTTPAVADLKPARRRLWSNWLWLLALVLSVATVWSGARVVHDGRLRRETLRMLAQSKADEIGQLALNRYHLILREAFGPVWTTRGDRQAVEQALRRYQQDRLKCRCPEKPPAFAFFTERRDAGSRHVVPLQIDASPNPVATIRILDPREGSDLVYGATVPAIDLARVTFDAVHRGRSADTVVGRVVISRMHMDMGADAHRGPHLLQLDSLSLRVSAGGRPLFGAIGDGRTAVTTTAPGPLAPFEITVAVRSSQAAMAVLMPVAHDRLLINGVLVLSTLLVVVFAVGSSRRELLLARARSDFIAGVSHDLRMPLAQILLASETLNLNRDRDAKERSSLTASIVREGRRLANMVDNLLLVTRTGAVGLEPRIAVLGVADLFTEVVESIHLAAADAGQSIETDAPAGMELRGDRNLLRQALVNLVDNAIKYGQSGQRIRLAASIDTAGTRLWVDDEGPGIPPADRERLFEPYERLGRDQTSERTGSGLGLAVVRQIVLAHRGSVTVGENGAGTRITITLPPRS